MDCFIDDKIIKAKNEDGEECEQKVKVLYCDGKATGYVRYLNHKYKDFHSYRIRPIKQYLLDQFSEYAKMQFPKSENPYIRYLDILMEDYKNRKKQKKGQAYP